MTYNGNGRMPQVQIACLGKDRYRIGNLFAGEGVTSEQVIAELRGYCKQHGRAEVLVYLMLGAPMDGSVSKFRERLSAIAQSF